MGKKAASPRVKITITTEHWDKAKKADSAACLISDAARRQYPHLTTWSTDMATIRATDRAAGVRYIWETPQAAQDLLLSFDQTWPQPGEHTIILNGAFKIVKVKTQHSKLEHKRARLAELEEKETAGTLTGRDRDVLARLRSTPERPTSEGPATDLTAGGTIIGGASLRKNPTKNPNLLAGRTRVYGARMAKPGVVFQQAVEAEVAARLARLAAGTADALESDAAPTAEGEGYADR